MLMMLLVLGAMAPFSNSHHRKIKKKKKRVCIQWALDAAAAVCVSPRSILKYLATVLDWQSMRQTMQQCKVNGDSSNCRVGGGGGKWKTVS